MSANMDTTGTFEMAEAFSTHKMITCLHKHYAVDEIVEWADRVGPEVCENVAITAGVSDTNFQKVKAVFEAVPAIKFICLDVANGYQLSFIKRIEDYRAAFPDKIIIAGNVVTAEVTNIMLQAGADIVKLGIGPGSVCTTRKQTGVGFPQLSCVLESASSAHNIGGYVVSDGGCTIPGDFAKAYAAGADFVMAGGIFAGHAESGGDLVVGSDGEQYKKFYGMSSDEAMRQYHGGVDEYRASEGKTVLLPYKGPVQTTILDLLGGIRSTCTYVNASKLEDLSSKVTFIRCSQQINEVFGKAPDAYQQKRE